MWSLKLTSVFSKFKMLQLRLKFGKILRTASFNLILIDSYKKKYTICRKKLRQVFLTLFNSVYFCHFWRKSNKN